MDWENAAKELSKPLERSHVAERQQVGRKLSYIEGWWAIAEANRIFGFDGWNRSTKELRLLGEPQVVGIGNDKAPGWSVSYFAKVRINVGDTYRDGCGYGSGIDRDLGRAHESAIKESETDAMKRALMTFGWPFGLALYDKTQAHVASNGDARKNTSEGDKLPSAYVGTRLIHPDTPADSANIKGRGPSAYSVKDSPLWAQLRGMSTLDAVVDWWMMKQPDKALLPWGHQIELFEEMIKQGCDVAESRAAMMAFLKKFDDDLTAMQDVDMGRYGDLHDYAKRSIQTKFTQTPLDAG